MIIGHFGQDVKRIMVSLVSCERARHDEFPNEYFIYTNLHMEMENMCNIYSSVMFVYNYLRILCVN